MWTSIQLHCCLGDMNKIQPVSSRVKILHLTEDKIGNNSEIKKHKNRHCQHQNDIYCKDNLG